MRRRDARTVRPSGPLTDEERYRFDLQGVLVRRGALSAEELRMALAAVDALDYPTPDGEIGNQRFHGYIGRDEIFRTLIDHPAVIDIVTELCGANVRLDHHYGIAMTPGTSGLWIHGGATPFDPSQYYVVRNGEMHSGLVAVAWNLVDAPPGVGGFTCIPGSHKANFELPESVDYGHELVVDIPLGAGDLIVFTEALTHGTATWRGGEERRLLFYKYSPGNSSWASEANGNVPHDVLPLLTDRQRLLCQAPAVAGHRPVYS